MVQIYTSQFNYKGPNRLDITSNSKDPIGKNFAPPKSLVNAYKYRGMSKEEYTDHYLYQLRRLYIYQKNVFNHVLSLDQVVFVCFCNKNSFCHRFILADCFVKLGADYKGEI